MFSQLSAAIYEYHEEATKDGTREKGEAQSSIGQRRDNYEVSSLYIAFILCCIKLILCLSPWY